MPTPEAIRKKLEHIQPTQESVETVSLWCLHHRDCASSIVSAWLQIFKNASAEKQRLSLFYLANDVCQKGRNKKGQDFLANFVPALKEAILLSRHDSIRQNIDRVLNIWQDRNVFDDATVKEFRSILEATKSASNAVADVTDAHSSSYITNNNNEAIMNEFSLNTLINDAERYQKSAETVERLRVLLPSTSLAASDGNTKALLKSRLDGHRFIDDINQSHKKLSDFVEECERRLKRHHQLVIALERAQIFYETQLNEAGIVQTAYEKFGAGVKAVRERLTEMQKSGNYNYIPRDDVPSPDPYDDPFADGIKPGTAPKKDSDKLESIDMDLDDDVKFSGVPNPARPFAAQETAIEGMKLATNQSFLNNPLPVMASNGARFSVELPPKKAKMDPRQQKHLSTHPAAESTLTSAQSQYAAPTVIPTTSNWPTDATGQHYAPPVASYPTAYGPGTTTQPTAAQLQTPPPFLSRPQLHSQVQYPMQHANYSGVPLPPPPPPPQLISVPTYGAGNHPYAASRTDVSEVGNVFDYDHGTTGVGSSSVAHTQGHSNNLTVPGHENTGHSYDAPSFGDPNIPTEGRTHRFHPPDPQYYDHQSYGGAGPSHSHPHQNYHHHFSHRGRGGHYGH